APHGVVRTCLAERGRVAELRRLGVTRKNEQSSGATRGDAARRWSYHVGRALRGATLSCLALGCDPEPPRRGPAPSVRLEPARASGAAAPSRSSHAPRAER